MSKTSKASGRSVFGRHGSILSFFCVAAAILALYFASGLRLCAVVSGSMEPNLPTWSLCVVSTRVDYADVEIGDIVVYERLTDGKRIIHRVIGIEEDGMVTKGDHNAIDDGLSITEEDGNLYGRCLFFVPYLGRLPALVRTPAGIAVVAVLLVLLIVSAIRDDKKAAEAEREKAE